MGSAFLQGMLSKKESVGFSIDYEPPPRHPSTTGDIAVDRDAPAGGDWGSLSHY